MLVGLLVSYAGGRYLPLDPPTKERLAFISDTRAALLVTQAWARRAPAARTPRRRAPRCRLPSAPPDRNLPPSLVCSRITPPSVIYTRLDRDPEGVFFTHEACGSVLFGDSGHVELDAHDRFCACYHIVFESRRSNWFFPLLSGARHHYWSPRDRAGPASPIARGREHPRRPAASNAALWQALVSSGVDGPITLPSRGRRALTEALALALRRHVTIINLYGPTVRRRLVRHRCALDDE